MRFLVVMAFLIAAAVIIVRLLQHLNKQTQKRSASQTPEDPFKQEVPVTGDPRDIRIGDVVELLGQSFGVRGTVKYTDGPYRWTEHYLDDAGGVKRWISVEEDPDLEVVMWTAFTDHGLNPDDKTVLYSGVQYARHESGSAIYTSSGTTGLTPSGHAKYIDYRAPNGRRLSFESFGGVGWEASSGVVVPSGMMTIYPVARHQTD